MLAPPGVKDNTPFNGKLVTLKLAMVPFGSLAVRVTGMLLASSLPVAVVANAIGANEVTTLTVVVAVLLFKLPSFTVTLIVRSAIDELV